MKIRTLVVTGMVCLTVGLVWAAEQQSAQRGAGERRASRPTGSVDREGAFRQMLAGRAQTHAEEMKELADLKKLAEEENATKTAAAIQAIIEKKNAEYQKSIEQFETQRRQRTEQLQKRLNERQTSREPAKSEPAEKTEQ